MFKRFVTLFGVWLLVSGFTVTYPNTNTIQTKVYPVNPPQSGEIGGGGGGGSGDIESVVAGPGLTGGGPAGEVTLTWDPSTRTASITYWDGTSASRTITYRLSGATDPVWTIGNDSVDLTTGVLKVGGVPVTVTTGNIATATALAANPTDCTQTAEIMAFAQTIAANGNLTCTILVVRKTTDPTTGDDTGDGYIVGTKWINTSGNRVYEALSVTLANAVWVQVYPQVITGLVDNCVPVGTGTLPPVECGSMTDNGTDVVVDANLCVGDCSGTFYQLGIFRAFFDAGSLTPDGTQCADATKQTLNGGPAVYTFSCADNASSIFYGQVALPKAINTATFKLILFHGTTETITFAGDFSAQCRPITTTGPNNTWGTPDDADVAITTANRLVAATTGAVTPDGNCSAGAMLYFRYVVDAANFSANAANSKVVGVFVEEAS